MTQPLPAARLEEIRERNAKRTQGELARSGGGGLIVSLMGCRNGPRAIFYAYHNAPRDATRDDGENFPANMDWLAHAPDDMTLLLGEVERLAGMNDRIANDRALDSDLANWARRQERQAVIAFLRSLPSYGDIVGVLGPQVGMGLILKAIEEGEHLEVKS